MKIDFSWVAAATDTTSDYGKISAAALDGIDVKFALPEIANRTLEKSSPQSRAIFFKHALNEISVLAI